MTVDEMRPDDATDLLRIAAAWGEPPWTMTEGAHGIVVREEASVRGFALLREMPYGHIIDELWEEPTRRGIRALSTLADWLESTVQRIATDRGRVTSLGGIVKLTNQAHYAALERRGFAPVAHVLAKDYAP